MSEHRARIEWRHGGGAFDYDTYDRNHTWALPNGMVIAASAAPAFLGDESKTDPEEAFVAALSSCHMLTFLAIAARKRLVVESYVDDAVGRLEKNADGQLAVTVVDLRPRVVFSPATAPAPDALEQAPSIGAPAVLHRQFGDDGDPHRFERSGRGCVSSTMLVSVIIPTHNRADRVVGAVESVLSQSETAHEVIVVDDGSTDDTRARLAPYRDRIRLEARQHRGVSSARNHGAGVARGDWLAFLDSDDEWLPDKLARQCAFHRAQPEISISQTGEIWIRNGVRVNPCKHHAKPRGDIFEPSLERCLVSPSAVMLRRDLFREAGGFDEGLPVCEDYDLWLRLGVRHRFGLVDEALMVKHGGHDDQLSTRYWGMDRFRVQSLSALLASGALRGDQRRSAIRTLRGKCSVLANGARKRGRAEDAKEYDRIAAGYCDA